MASSFKKRVVGKPSHPHGTRPSLHNAQLLVSTGIPSLDALLGGGLAVGSVLLIEEDRFGSYSRLLLKYFLSEGVMSGHTLFVGRAGERGEDLLQDLPGSVDDERNPTPAAVAAAKRTEDVSKSVESEQMKIAWRYQSMPQVQSSFSNRFGHFFDLTTHMDKSRIESVEKICFNALDFPASSASELYTALKASIQESILKGNFSTDQVTPKRRNVLRIALMSLGSPLWLDEGDTSPSLPQFLHSLRALLRRSYSVAVVTIPTHLIQNTAHVKRLERLCDAVVELESFAGSENEQNPVYKEYHGLFHIHKLPCLNSLISHFPETLDLAFKLRRKKFAIEKLHLPPELSETVSRAQDDPTTSSQQRHTTPSLTPSSATSVQPKPTSGTSSRTTPAEKRIISKHNVDF